MEKEMEEIIKRAKDGDEEAKTSLLEKYTPLVYSLSRNIYIKGYDAEDLVQEGFNSILKAITKYDPEKGVEFGYYLKQSIKFNYYYIIRQKSRANFETSLNKKSKEGVEYINTIEDEFNLEDNIIGKEEMVNLFQALEILKKEERELIDMVFSKGYGGIKSYAKLKGLNYSLVSKRKDRIIEKLRQEMLKCID
ncbi:sigma-70 family RNA polymerase sigma factor [Clostridium algidicarnis]|uniref:sigma-70 family RNA polymerase sigma factor n=1 Tax=Clostridium algidicarnis TaxID=37659 RepID=UPI001C0D2AE8|nr:sigma-70 family RNA polymerase sigma factor [Clostridium algidicarnis]MBU3207613.1 sigma-70 family RNA polymerase sigma factor [Clostridium algidicarnis]MCB2287727.1 sigma-70 family RNA polymerase sigma factor [Clostridium algidicarnis]